jgi:hypothetical protein
MQAREFFRRLTDRQMVVIVDREDIAEVARSRGFSAVPIQAFKFDRDGPALLLLSTYKGHEYLKPWLGKARATFAHVAMAKFDNSASATAYALDRVLMLDIGDALDRRRRRYRQMLRHRSLRVMSGKTPAVLGVNLAKRVEIVSDTELMEPGWMYSVAEYLEASVINLAGDGSSVVLDGYLAFDGMIHLCNRATLKASHGEWLGEMGASCRPGENAIEFRNNRAVSIMVGGEDVSAIFHERFHAVERGLACTDFALGCARHPVRAQWQINSLLNEGVYGAHVGIGMGKDMPHIDFIAAGARLMD